MKQIVKNLVFLALMSVLAVNASAQLVWDGTSSPWTHGTGTASDPYLIETPQNLAWLSDMVNSGTTYSGVYFKQTADFNMNGNNYYFYAIGDDSSSHYFSGHYDGDFNSISNLVISNASNYIGLFGNTQNANLHGICVNGICGTGTSCIKYYVGSICANSLLDTIIECCCIGNLVLSEEIPSSASNVNETYVGGLVGRTEGSYIANCFVRGNVSCTRNMWVYYYAGGLVGGMCVYHNSSSSTETSSMVRSCYFIGNLNISGTVYSKYIGYPTYATRYYSTAYGLLIGAVLLEYANSDPFHLLYNSSFASS